MTPWERRAPARQNENLSSSSPAPKQEWYSRGYLPHRDRPGLLQMITYGLADSLPKEVLARIDADDKSRTGARRSQRVWMREYWDRFIRDENHLRLVVEYIHQNPVKAGLAMPATQWPWSSAKEWAARESEDGRIDVMENNLNNVSSTLKKRLDIDADG